MHVYYYQVNKLNDRTNKNEVVIEESENNSVQYYIYNKNNVNYKQNFFIETPLSFKMVITDLQV